MKFSKRIQIIAGILLASMAVSLVGCNGGTSDKNNTEGTTTTMDNIIPEVPDIPGIGSLTRQAAADGMVLLKNDAYTLPLTTDDTVAIFGAGQINLIKGGTGSGDVKVEKTVNLLEGLEEKEGEGKVHIYKELADKYKANANYEPTDDEIAAAAQNSSTAIFVITRNSGEGGDRSTNDYSLSSETRMLNKLSRAGFQEIVVILNVGGLVDTTALLNSAGVTSILLAWQGGQEMGLALADLLVGDVTPSGKLADTMAKSFNDYPSSANFNESADYAEYSEDIFVGYRYFETFDPNYERVNFEFGFGLSYTTFEISDVKVTEAEGKLNVSAKVTNTGSFNGKEVVQVYYSAHQGKLGNPAKELAAFAKTKTLAPGSSQVLEMSFDINDMAAYDDTGKVQESAYVLEAGDYNVYVGNSIRNAGLSGVRYTYKVDETVVVEQLTERASAKLLEERLLADGTYEDIYDESGIATAISGVTRIEAEDYYAKHRHADIAYKTPTYDVIGVKTNTSGEGARYITIAVDAPEAGEYILKLGVANPGSSLSDALKISVNSQVAYSKVGILPKTSDVWTAVETDGISLDLKKGVNFIKVEFIITNINIFVDYFTVAPASQASVDAANLASSASAAAVSAASIASVEEIEASAAARAAINFNDVLENPALLDDYVAQLSVHEINKLLHGRSGPNEDKYADTGIIGGIDELDIPAVQTSDGPAGLRFKATNTTAYPIETLLACTWNTDMLYAIGEALAKEASVYGVDIWLSPAVNIHRSPLTGRNFEYYSEDPYLSGMMASAIISGCQDNGLGVMLKHFVGNEKETNRVYTDTRVSERALREIYLKPFQIAVEEANPWVIMSSYNKINGVYVAENHDLLTGILREEWGYDGLVSSDWWNTSVAYRELNAGESLKMKTSDGPGETGVYNAYMAGEITREQLEWNAKQVLTLIIRSETAQASK